ncbi:hypothetical protein ACFL6L_03555 [candidate division KSB1 bacterium]
MKIKIFVMILTACFLFSAVAAGQGIRPGEVEKVKAPRMADFFVNLSSTGTGIGLKVHYQTADRDTRISLGVQLSGIRGEDDYTYFDYYTYTYRKKSSFFTLVMPVTAAVKRRIWRESIEDNFRPFLIAEAGPAYGISFPTRYKFSKNFNKGKGQVTLGAFLGFGVDFGSQAERTYGVTLGYSIMPFAEKLGEKKKYKGFVIRFNFLNYF